VKGEKGALSLAYLVLFSLPVLKGKRRGGKKGKTYGSPSSFNLYWPIPPLDGGNK